YMRGRPDPCRARSVCLIAALSQAPPYAGGRGTLRRIFRQGLAGGNLPDGEKNYPSGRMSFLPYRLNSPRLARARSALIFSDGVVSRSFASRASQSMRVADTTLPERLSKRRSSQRPFLSVSTTMDVTRCADSPPLAGAKGAIFDAAFVTKTASRRMLASVAEAIKVRTASTVDRGAACLSSIRSAWDAVRE